MIDDILVADIGGTNARFAIAKLSERGINFSHRLTLQSADYHSFEDALQHYLKSLPSKPNYASLAVAGFIQNREVSLTNLNWHFTCDNVVDKFRFKCVHVVNDFAAFAFAAPQLEINNNHIIKNGSPMSGQNILVVGAGTGFGVAAVHFKHNAAHVISSEAGHIALSPQSEYQQVVLSFLQRQFGFVSIEHVLSGNGIKNLYAAVCDIEQSEHREMSAEQITNQALNEGDPICLKVVELFYQWFAQTVGDLTLTFNATGGVFVGGGIVPKLITLLDNRLFIEQMLNKGKMAALLNDVPVTLVTQDNIPFTGAVMSMREVLEMRLS